ncbi:hypothetical protein [Streptomyces sp. NPDC056308]|uniref:hypothetical protein n=1 Tax=Streptomyces sp. NPDC056308 TaxID=3345780 RepID=UPI0035D67AF3
MGYLPTPLRTPDGRVILSGNTGARLLIALAELYAEDPGQVGALLVGIDELREPIEAERHLDGAGYAAACRDLLVEDLLDRCGGDDVALDGRPVPYALWQAGAVAHEARRIAEFADAHAREIQVRSAIQAALTA